MTLARRNETRTNHMVPSLFNDFDSVFDTVAAPLLQSTRTSQYPIDLYDDGEALVLDMATPGLTAEDLDVSLEGRHLTIRGHLPEQDGDNRRYWLQSIPRGEFTRSLTLPTAIDADAIEATVRNGMLHLVLPKQQEARARKITVNAE